MSAIVDINIGHAGQTIIDSTHQRSAVLLNDVFRIFKLPVTIPLPLIGFYYAYDSDIEMLRYDYGEHVYLNKQMLSLASIKQSTTFNLLLYSPLEKAKPFHSLPIWNEGIIKGLEYYIDRGGTFTVLTMWGARINCVGVSVSGVYDQSIPNGSAFRIEFKKLLFSNSGMKNVLSKTFSLLQKGGAV